MASCDPSAFPADRLAEWVLDARTRTLDLVEDLDESTWETVPRLAIVNPTRWEIGHVAWFQERWVLRHCGGNAPIHRGVDAFYDSMAVEHDTRWDLALPDRDGTLGYLREAANGVLARIEDGALTEADVYFILLSTFHEDMHDEAFTYTRQTLGLPAPTFRNSGRGGFGSGGDRAKAPRQEPVVSGPYLGDVEVPGGVFHLGSERSEAFVFDNEQWAHAVEVEPFAISRAPVTQSEFAAFVEDAGYARPELWSEQGWAWREAAGAELPAYWRRTPTGFERRAFDRWVALEPYRPVQHVSWLEADAYCRWVGRRLPTEAEWEAAAIGTRGGDGRLADVKRRYPWGDERPGSGHLNCCWNQMGTVDVASFPAGDSAFGCRQMLGNVWEWTADDFGPFPGFEPGPYKDYSVPWFGDHKVLRGGAWMTRARLIRGTVRNFYRPDRRDVYAGFRTCVS